MSYSFILGMYRINHDKYQPWVAYMPRLPRITPAEVTVHLIQRGNNRQTCFAAEDDYVAYLTWLKDFSCKYKVDIHAWVLMTNHVHLLCTPHAANTISKMMQDVGRRYVQYFNREYQRSGTLWEGRFKSCLVHSDDTLLALYKYIELNPVRAGMVNDPAAYHWSSYQVNGLGKKSALCTPHYNYLELGKTKVARQEQYRNLFLHEVDGELLQEIRDSTNKGMAVGNDRFKAEIEALTGRRLHLKKRGRPLGWRKKKD